MKNLYIIAGCNGAGKTTASMTVLPEILNCYEFVNADEIAKGLSPFQPEKVAIEAGRIMLKRLKDLLESGVDFAFETTLSTRSYVSFIKEAALKDYKITLIFVYLKNAELAKKRVRERVLRGGHNIENDVIERRYAAGLKNFFQLYMPICNLWMVVDNSAENFDLTQIAYGSFLNVENVSNQVFWNKLIDDYGK
jgi:predicted ABC-type ATPase